MICVGLLLFFCIGWIGIGYIDSYAEGYAILKFPIASAATITPGLESRIIDVRRPIWNIAHMVNAAYQVNYYLDEGANSIEFDIAFNNDGEPKFTYHGVPCDCFRVCTRHERFTTFLQYLRRLTTPDDPEFRKQLVLLFMDLKLSRISGRAIYQAGVNIANNMIAYYWPNVIGNSVAVAYVILSIPSIDQFSFIDGFRSTLEKEGFSKYLDRIGYDFSNNENLDSIRSTYDRLNINENIWQGDGITNCLPRGTRRLREALWRRDTDRRYAIDKVYWWTVDKMSTIRSVLRLEVDGIITNYPDRLVRVLQENEFLKEFRMANIDDNPFTRFAPMKSSPIMEEPYIGIRIGNITHVFEIEPDSSEEIDEVRVLKNYENPDEKHFQMEVNPFHENPPPIIAPHAMRTCVRRWCKRFG